MQSQVEAGQREEASRTAIRASAVARKRVPEQVPEVLGLQARLSLEAGEARSHEKGSPQTSGSVQLGRIRGSVPVML